MRGRAAAVLGIVALLAGCATAPPGDDAPAAEPPTDWAAARVQFAAEHPVPPQPPAYTEEEARAAAARRADEFWTQQVLPAHPDAVRPEGGFIAWLDEEDVSATSPYATCLQERGMRVTVGETAPGEKAGYSYSGLPSTESDVAHFYCGQVAYPMRPHPRETPEQLAYMYDYLTEFLVPCLEAHGHEQQPAIDRDRFIAEWPRQGWYPASEMTGDPEKDADIAAICPPHLPSQDAAMEARARR
ncbi:hypothetical protein [Diaminobutyricimonas aerilata]|uniref:hypothetical protein n=1 Tax=Diaminobutyricimonas aerilata TaxID=1162967 RepID=UPI0012FE0388|nr:hypothetical protein [Diaminobutyricimonas aerilata]